MLIIVPPSESKRPPAAAGAPVDLDRLSFPELTATRRTIADALVRTSGDLDAFRRLQVRPTKAPEVAANTHLFELPAVPVLELYTGPLHDGLDSAGLSRAAAERAQGSLVVNSALWGLLRPSDRVPPYRLHVCAHLVGLEDIEPLWRESVPDVLAKAAGPAGVVVDLRSPTYQATGRPAGLGDRTVTLRVDLGPRGDRIGDVVAKRVRGEAAHHLLERGVDPQDAGELAAVLAARWPARLAPPDRAGHAWTLTLSID
ncbi:MAG TPA: peroxide stress protein YaaA [Candidatus Limnocylindrales bacterium]|nr:peroxide stress protein YaaA [Candidatus Limnocylindrales bacterium]